MIHVGESAPRGRDFTYFLCRWGCQDIGECWDCVTERQTLCGSRRKEPESGCDENILKISSKNGLGAAECEDLRFVCPSGQLCSLSSNVIG